MTNDTDKAGSTDTIQAIKDIRTDFRLRGCQILMAMCNDIGDAIQTCTDAKTKTKFKMIECRNALLSKVETMHKNEQKDAEIAKKTKRKNGTYRRIKFNENELKMLEEVVELKNDPNNKALQSQKAKKKNSSSKSKRNTFISRAGNEQKHKNYKEFVKKKQDEFNKKKPQMIAEYKNKSQRSSKILPPITPKNLENVKQIKTDDKNQCDESEKMQKLIQNEVAAVKQEEMRRFELSKSMTLKSQMKQLKKLKKIKLNELNNPSKQQHRYRKKQYDDAFGFSMPGQL